MKKPGIVALNQQELDILTRKIDDSNLDIPTKDAVLDTLEFTIELQKKLLDAKISIASLKRLFANEGEALKKLFLTS